MELSEKYLIQEKLRLCKEYNCETIEEVIELLENKLKNNSNSL